MSDRRCESVDDGDGTVHEVPHELGALGPGTEGLCGHPELVEQLPARNDFLVILL